MKLKILKKLSYLKRDYKENEIVEVKSDKHGTPLDSFWRNRIKDSEIDNCVEIIKEVKDFKIKKEDK